MKKGIIVLLIAVLVSGFAFAKFSGSAGVIYDAKLSGNTAFGTTNASSFDFSFEFASEKVEIAGDEDVHVEVAASAKFILGTFREDAYDIKNGIYVLSNKQDHRGIGAVISLDTAKIVGKNWYVDITGTQDAYDYATAAVLTINDRTKKDDFGNKYAADNSTAASYALNIYDALDGITVGFNDFTASLGLEYEKDADLGAYEFAANATIETPEFAFSDDAVKAQAAAEFFRGQIGDDADYVFFNGIGASAKATVAVQDITVKAAVDMGLESVGTKADSESRFNIDARVDFKYDFVDFNIYTYAGKDGRLEYGKTKVDGADFYDAYEDFYLEAKAAFDFNAFELPFKVTVSAKNITNAASFNEKTLVETEKAGIVPAIKVEYAKDAITAAASFDINTTTKDWNVFVYGTYAFEKFTAGAGIKFAGKTELSKVAFAAFAESDKLVKGAVFGLGYGLNAADSKKFYGKGGATAIADADQYTTDFKNEKYGNIAAYCKIAF